MIIKAGHQALHKFELKRDANLRLVQKEKFVVLNDLNLPLLLKKTVESANEMNPILKTKEDEDILQAQLNDLVVVVQDND